MLQLLPPICRDCGKSADEAKLSPYLDFHLCAPCISAREREVLRVEGIRRRPASKKSKAEGRGGKTAKPKQVAKGTKAAKPKPQKRGSKGPRPKARPR